MKISVIGLGGVGYAASSLMAAAGYKTVGVDINPRFYSFPARTGALNIP